jgi:hypothetical protein
MLSSPVSSSAVNSNNNSLITSLSSSLSSTLPSSQANAMNSLSTSKTEILPGVMNGPLSAGGVLHKVSLWICLFKYNEPLRKFISRCPLVPEIMAEPSEVTWDLLHE